MSTCHMCSMHVTHRYYKGGICNKCHNILEHEDVDVQLYKRFLLTAERTGSMVPNMHSIQPNKQPRGVGSRKVHNTMQPRGFSV